MKNLVMNLLKSALLECCHPEIISAIIESAAYENSLNHAYDDLIAFSEKDPAAMFDPNIVAVHYSSYRAVLHYRLAHELFLWSESNNIPSVVDCARLLSARGKLLSGAEIHHHCSIGKRFILDHGMGTVIGETCLIGDDCYVLGGVTIGSTGIASNPTGKRHPTIGHRVQIGAFARLFGNITIGDDVFIGPHCVIKDNLPANSVVTMRSQNQITKLKSDSFNNHSAEIA